MTFSILMPVYKAEKYLKESVDSILNQDWDDYELILAEDGSPDASGELCDRLAQSHPQRIRVLHLPHQGTIMTRRRAIEAARGDYILWLDSDDLMVPGTLAVLEKLLKTHQYPDIILYEYTAFFEDGRPDDKRPPLFADLSLFEGEDAKRPLYELYIRGNALSSLCTKAVRRELFQSDPGDYSLYTANPYDEDALHGLYPLTHARRILYTGASYCRYRIRKDSVMHEFDAARLDQRFNTGKLRFFAPYLTAWGLDDSTHRMLLKSNAYRSVLDGILFFMLEEGYDQKQVRAYGQGFVDKHPEIRRFSRLKALPLKQRIIFALFAGKHFRTLKTAVKLQNRLKSLKAGK